MCKSRLSDSNRECVSTLLYKSSAIPLCEADLLELPKGLEPIYIRLEDECISIMLRKHVVEQTGIEPVSLGLQSSTLTNSVTDP
jgi:hypothetical protein